MNFYDLKSVTEILNKRYFFRNKSFYFSRDFLRIKRFRFLFLFTILYKVNKMTRTIPAAFASGINEHIHRFLYMLVWTYWYKRLHGSVKIFLTGILSFFSNFDLIVDIYAIDSYNVNAYFIARYIAKKMKQNYTVWELLNPIRKEIGLVQHHLTPVNFNDVGNLFGTVSSSQIFKDGAFKRALSYCFVYAKNWYTFFLNRTYSRLNLELLVIYSDYFLKLDKLSIIHWSYITSKNRTCLKFFYFYNWDHFFPFLFKEDNLFNLQDTSIEPLFWYVVAEECMLSVLSLVLADFFLRLDCKAIVLSNFFLSRFMLFTFWTFNYNSFFSVNQKFFWNKPTKPVRGITGLKFRCTGRFSRRQRKSVVRFIESKVPLNTLSANIDYGFFSIPLKNSAISVKLWIYRTKFLPSFYFKLT